MIGVDYSSSLHCTLVAVSIAYLLSVGTAIEENITETVSTGNSVIHCYQCNSIVDKSCPTLKANDTNSIHYKPCNQTDEYKGQQPFCRKIVQTIFERDNMVRVVRKCGWERHQRQECYYTSNDDHIEAVCQCFTDGCNAATFATLAAPLAAVSFASYLLVS